MSDRLAEIRARLDAANMMTWPRWHEVYRSSHWFFGELPPPFDALYAHAPADIAWLLAENYRLQMSIDSLQEATDA